MLRLLLLLASAPCHLFAQVILTEVHPIPLEGAPEWVEIHNVGSDPMQLDDWSIADARSSVALPPMTIPANGFVVITDGIDGNLPTLNNTTDDVSLTIDGELVSAMSYDAGELLPGNSIERHGRVVDDKLEYSTLWLNSNHGSTPGAINSSVEREFDLAVTSVDIQGRSLAIVIRNAGWATHDASGVIVDGEGAQLRRSVPLLKRGVEHQVLIPVSELGGQEQTSVEICCSVDVEDDNSINNSLCVMFTVPTSERSVAINEVLFDPLPGGNDWVEVFNPTDTAIDLSGWLLADERSSSEIPSGTMIGSDGYLVLAMGNEVRLQMDSGVPIVIRPAINFNSTGDDVILMTPDGFVVDQVRYDDSWHSDLLADAKGISLERLSAVLVSQSSGSWTSSGDASGGTPGRQNSAGLDVPAIGEISAFPSPFSSDPASRSYTTTISAELPFRNAVVRVSIYDESGNLIARLLNGVYVSAYVATTWNGSDARGKRVLPGPYIAVVEAVDAESSAVFNDSCMVVVGE